MYDTTPDRTVGLSSNTVDRIIDAALAEFATRGLDGATLDSIADNAGVTKQLIHHYFGKKNDLYVAVLEFVSRISYRELSRINYDSLPPTEAFVAFLSNIFDWHSKYYFVPGLTLDQNLHSGIHISKRNMFIRQQGDIISALERILQRGCSDGVFKKDIAAKRLYAIASTVMAGYFCNGTIYAVCRDDGLTDKEEEEFWRTYSINFLLAYVSNRPAVVSKGRANQGS